MPAFENSLEGLTPIVVIGMHRSGTSFLARLLEECGLFMGADTQGNHESVLFMQVNDELLFQCHATWNNPFAAYLALQSEERVETLAQDASLMLKNNASRFAAGGLSGLSAPWGWKDPRNTFTLPIWLKLFPNLKVLHIRRHGVDVANSLYQRDWADYHNSNGPYIPPLSVQTDELGLRKARRGWTLEQAFTLWEEYVQCATQLTNGLGSRALSFKYEDFLADADTCLRRAVEFCQCPRDLVTRELVDSVNPDRAYAYKQDERLIEFAEQRSQALTAYGY